VRNGLNISGVSELVHEIQEVPAEALIRFHTTGGLDAGRVAVDVLTARHGTIRMARGFGLRMHPAGTDRLSAYETTVAAVGACVLITHVHGYTARGVLLSELSVTVSADAGDGVLGNLRYRVDVSCDGDTEQLAAVSQFVTCFSPNHRALLDAAEVEVTGLVRRSSGETGTVPLDLGPVPSTVAGSAATVEATLRWEYGTECEALTRVGDEPWRSRFTVDQSKQMIGIDKGPNPQEVLLAAVSGDLAPAVAAAAATAGVPVANVEVDGRGQLDIRGMMNIAKEAPARFHDIRFVIALDSDAPLDDVRAVLETAARASAPLSLIRPAREVDVEVYAEGDPVISFTSNLAQATEFLARIAETQQAAAAAAAAAQEGAADAPAPA
jgi:uncharacterized OsmC-like protein